MANCGFCGVEAPPGARYCPSCGRALPETPLVYELSDFTPPPDGAGPGAQLAAAGVDPAALRGLAIDTAVALGVQLAFLFVVAAFVGLALLPEGAHGNPVDWARAAVLAAGAGVRAGIGLLEPVGLFFSEDEATLTVFVQPLLATLAGLGPLALLASWRERREPSPSWQALAARGATSGVLYAGGLLVLGYVARGPAPYSDGEAGLGLRPASLLLGGLLFGPAAAVLGRVRGRLRANGGAGLRAAVLARAGSWAGAVAAAATMFAVTVAGGAVYAVVDVTARTPGVADRFRAAAAAVLLAPNTGLDAGAMSMGTSLRFSGTYGPLGGSGDRSQIGDGGVGFGSSYDVGLFASGMPGGYRLLLLLPLLAAVVGGVRAAARRDPATTGWRRTTIVLPLIWLPASLLVQMAVTARDTTALLGWAAGGAFHATLSLSAATLVASAAVFGLVTGTAARFATRPVAATFPRLFARLAGPGLHPEWERALVRLRGADAGVAAAAPGTPALARAPAVVPYTDEILTPDIAGSVPPPPPRPPVVLDRRRGSAVLLLGVVVLTLVAGLSSARTLLLSGSGPAGVATDYLEAVARGDAAAALAQAVDDPPVDGTDLLDQEVLTRQRDAGRITELEVDESRINGDLAEVDYSFQVGGWPARGTLELRRTRGGLFPEWKITEPGATVEVRISGSVSAVVVNGERVPVLDGRAIATAFPGRFVVDAVEDTGYFTARASAHVAATGEREQIRFEVELSSDGERAVLAAVDAKFRACAEERTLVPPGCPFDGRLTGWAGSEVSDVRWTVVAPPSSTDTALRYDEFAGTIEITGQARLQVSYRFRDAVGGMHDQREDVFAPFSGTARFVGRTVVLELRPF